MGMVEVMENITMESMDMAVQHRTQELMERIVSALRVIMVMMKEEVWAKRE